MLCSLECPNPDTTTSTDEGGFNITINGTNSNDVTVEDLLSMSNNTFCSNVTIELKSNCDEGVARIMIVQIDVHGVSTVKISLLDQEGGLLPNGAFTVSMSNIFTSIIDDNDVRAACLPTNLSFCFKRR